VSETILADVLGEAGAPSGRVVSPFEFWPGWLFYAPIVAQWIGLGLRYGDFTLPCVANPGIDTGGLCGERKSDILDLVQGEARDWIAPYATFRTGAGDDLASARAAMACAGIDFPVVVKPDIGCNGTGVRLVADAATLARVLAGFPRDVGLMVQQLIPHEGEVGLFTVRRPGEAHGRVTSVTLKFTPFVLGDGRSTLRELILADPRAGRIPQLYLPRLEGRLDDVPAPGERVRLVFSGNHCKGSIFRDGTAEVTPALAERVDRIARAIPDFHFGRIDARYESLAALRRGEFTVIEINGVGSEATHVWDPDTRLRDAYAAQFFHYRAAFEIGREMRARGHKAAGLRALFGFWRRQKRLMASYPMND
jgi:hypothetical protein